VLGVTTVPVVVTVTVPMGMTASPTTSAVGTVSAMVTGAGVSTLGVGAERQDTIASGHKRRRLVFSLGGIACGNRLFTS
jgi:hypothetical protein